MEYTIVTTDTRETRLDKKKAIECQVSRINDMIAKGWEPLGGIATSSCGGGIEMLFQAMIRD
ncbi:MAG: hypothetical protein HGB36_07435 [Chlorobiaceae bacterium]|nr:hypothetical protein [Chlorobiaceae bacterium]